MSHLAHLTWLMMGWDTILRLITNPWNLVYKSVIRCNILMLSIFQYTEEANTISICVCPHHLVCTTHPRECTGICTLWGSGLLCKPECYTGPSFGVHSFSFQLSLFTKDLKLCLKVFILILDANNSKCLKLVTPLQPK